MRPLNAKQVLDLMPRFFPRYLQTALLWCLDYTYDEIAAAMTVSPHTVNNHLRYAVDKYDLEHRRDLRYAPEIEQSLELVNSN